MPSPSQSPLIDPATGAADAALIGSLSHRAIPVALDLLGPERADVTSWLQIAQQAAARVVTATGPARRAQLQRVTADAINYLRWWLPPPAWTRDSPARPEGGPPVPDLMWVSPDGIWYDELKTGAGGITGPGVVVQTRAQLAAGIARHPHHFAGVRVLALHRPHGYLLTPGEQHRALHPGLRDPPEDGAAQR